MTQDLRIDRQFVSLRTLAADRIRDAIVTGTFEPGTRLSERELCEMLDVSRALLRECLRQLESEGLVEIPPHKGPRVPILTAEDARDLYGARRALECFVAREAATHASAQDKKTIRAAYSQLERASRRRSVSDVLDAALALDRALMAAAGNSVVSQLLEQLLARISWLRRLSLSEANRRDVFLTEVQAVCEAVLTGDADNAEHLTEQHIRNAEAAALRAIDG